MKFQYIQTIYTGLPKCDAALAAFGYLLMPVSTTTCRASFCGYKYFRGDSCSALTYDDGLDACNEHWRHYLD